MEDQRDDRLATNDPAGSGSAWRARAPAPAARDTTRQPLPTRVEGLPELPPVFGAALDAGLVALQLRLAPAQRSAIEGHVRLMLAWNAAINLTAIVEPLEIAVRHVVDSLTAVELIRRRRIDRVIDLGSGAGYPGIPLAIAVPLRELLVVESVAKKARFLATVAEALSAGGLPTRLRVAAQRAEAIAHDAGERDAWPAVIARAVAPLGDLVELAFPMLQPGGVLIAWKRGPVDAEIASGQRAAEALGGGRIEAIEAIDAAAPSLVGHRLVIAIRTGTVSPGFPRDPRVRRRRPW